MPRLSTAAHGIVLSLLLILGWAAVGRAACPLRPGDEVLVVNVRGGGCTTNAETLAAAIRVSEYVLDEDGCRRWIPSDFDRFAAGSASGVRTIIWIHGNQETAADARVRGLSTYRALTRRASVEDGPVRFVIFSWPSAKVPGLLRDFREKAARTRPTGWQLAWTIDQLPSDEPLSLIGYSYGARIVGGALHLLAGGDLGCGLRLDSSPSPRGPMPVVFMAPAVHAHWFGVNGHHGRAMELVEQLYLHTNRNDPAMKYYRFVDKNSTARAMGLAGPTCLDFERRSRVRCSDVTRSVGRTHDLYRYLSVCSTMDLSWQTLNSPPVESSPVELANGEPSAPILVRE